jgi:membrane complex biogenesis BtpA family protein
VVTGRLHDRLGARPLIGVAHLPPSLGRPGFAGPERALSWIEEDLRALVEGGCDAVMLENEHDDPTALTVSRTQVAWLARVAAHARARCDRPLGLNVQRIDWEASISIAAAAELDMIRLDVFVDRVRMAGHDAIVEPAEVLRLRSALGADRVLLLTDVQVKHAESVGALSITSSARRARGAGSDAVIVTGDRTGEPPSIADLAAAREGAAPLPVLVGSGFDADNARALAPHAAGVLVGTSMMRDGRIDSERVARVVSAWRSASE